MQRWRSGVLAVLALAGHASVRGNGAPGSGPPVSDARTPLPVAFHVVVRGSPACRASVSGERVLLECDGNRRILPIVLSDALFDGRIVVAEDERGTVEIRVTPRLCQDGEDGPWLPYTARVGLGDAAPRLGCGGPIDDPLAPPDPPDLPP